jgi:hypothetical protein
MGGIPSFLMVFGDLLDEGLIFVVALDALSATRRHAGYVQ